ncbi:Cna protein B-type domain protein [Candidatus Sulfotelmatomonas gaucii]|uniref:Cna protein B-type domain protein n=1 Tax=Candidatus Sulfuritelmatomonas gaucii TaxID=2043161 RepID=A0A2N9LZC4_9BACT|nr:Cna protein B-type domain protein [Candidatus Sulfotelmatomonas gaucii]
MPFIRGAILRILPLVAVLFAALSASAQSGNAGTIRGIVTDPSGAVVANATVHLTNAVSEFDETSSTDATGQFSFPNVPFNPYRIDVSAKGFAHLSQNVEIRSSVGVNIKLVLQVSGGSQTVTVESQGDLIEDDPTFHVDVDRDLFNKVPLESASSTLSSLVTLTTPGVAADSNGLFHGLGDHASNSFAVDGQSITDQQSKIFSNQLPSNSIQSIEVISGAPPAEYGDKTSLVIVATTRSGQGVTKPTGDIYASYGSFGSAAGGFDLSYGGKSWGNFVEMDGLNTGRFLDPPEFTVFHDKGNEQNFFDRIDYSFSSADSIHWDLNYSRSWFQTPNSFDNLDVQNVVSGGTSASPILANVGNTDQLSKINTYDVAPTYTHIISNDSVFNLGAFLRRDGYGYYPSGNPLADLGPIQTSSIAQYRTLTNAGVHADYSYVKGVNNLKIGAQYEHTFLREHDNLGVIDSTYNAPCVDADGNPQPGLTDPSQCASAGLESNDPSVGGTFDPILLPYDLTRGGAFYHFFGHTDVKELALYIEDEIKAGNWDFNLGLREDLYNGLTDANQTEPRVGIAYNIKPSGTVMAVSYARTLETPFNENLVLSSSGCSDAVLNPLLACSPGVSGTLDPGYRNEFHASLQQALGKYAVFGGEYIWKYTHNAFDFSILGNTPIFFPIDWHNSKIPGYALHVEVPNFHGISAYTVMSSVAARFFPPQSAGAGATVGQSGYPFRIDHDEKFNQTTHLQYTVSRDGSWANGLWGGFNWRYDSGLVAGSVPFASDTTTPVDLSGLTFDQQAQAGLTCNGVAATLAAGFQSCAPSKYSSKLVSIPAPGTENDDHNPPRIAPRNLFDVTLGKNNIFGKEHYKTNLDFTAINVTNKYALYNFLSTFSGTHYVTPRALTAKITLNF